MLKPPALILLLLSLSLITSCDDQPTGSSRESLLDKESVFIAAVLTPDSLRDYHQEVFVGRIIPNGDAPPVTPGEDKVVNRVLMSMRQTYFAEFRGSDDAEVYVSDETGNRVQFTSVGNGFYRDVSSELRVKPLGKYSLEVRHKGSSYMAETTVPGSFRVTNTNDGDTVVVPKIVTYAGDRIPHWRMQWTSSANAVFYAEDIYSELVKGYAMGHTFLIDDIAVPFPFGKPDRIHFHMEAIDSNYSKIYSPEHSFAGTIDWLDWFSTQDALTIRDRSTISGPNDVAGVFGSYSQVRLAFVGIPVP